MVYLIRGKNRRFEAFVFQMFGKTHCFTIASASSRAVGVELATGVEPSALHHFYMLLQGNIMMITVPCCI